MLVSKELLLEDYNSQLFIKAIIKLVIKEASFLNNIANRTKSEIIKLKIYETIDIFKGLLQLYTKTSSIVSMENYKNIATFIYFKIKNLLDHLSHN